MTPKVEIPTILEFLRSAQLESCCAPPFVHTTRGWRLGHIVNDGLAFKPPSDNSFCYLFAGRADFKWLEKYRVTDNTAPIVFILRNLEGFDVAGIHPFDTGAYEGGILPGYITEHPLDDYKLGREESVIGRLIAAYFKTTAHYLQGEALSTSDFIERHALRDSMGRHHKITVLADLYNDWELNGFDGRGSCIEVQIGSKMNLIPANILGIVVPEPLMGDKQIMSALAEVGCRVEGYSLYPKNWEALFGKIAAIVSIIVSEREP